MDAVNTVKPVTGVVATDYARPAAVVALGATPTDLPDAKAVNPPVDTTPSRQEASNSGPSYITHGFVIDPQSQEVVYRVMDTRTRQVLWQVPDAALLRSRAYAQTLKDTSQPASTANQTDVTK
jgi:hypothetical protein